VRSLKKHFWFNHQSFIKILPYFVVVKRTKIMAIEISDSTPTSSQRKSLNYEGILRGLLNMCWFFRVRDNVLNLLLNLQEPDICLDFIFLCIFIHKVTIFLNHFIPLQERSYSEYLIKIFLHWPKKISWKFCSMKNFFTKNFRADCDWSIIRNALLKRIDIILIIRREIYFLTGSFLS
jgi:hypothetical protein